MSQNVTQSPESYLVERPVLTPRRRRLVWIAVPLGLAVIFGAIARTSWLDGLERTSIDMRFQYRGPIRPDPRIVIVEIDEESRRTLSEEKDTRFDLRSSLDDAITRLADAGAVAIGVDVRLQGAGDADTDAKLAEAMAETNTVLAVAYTQGYVIRPAAVFLESRPLEGSIAVSPDPDGVLRRLPANPNLDVLHADGKSFDRIPHFPFVLAHLALADAAQHEHRPPPVLDLSAGGHATIAGREVPYGCLLNYATCRGNGFVSLRLDDVAGGNFDPRRIDGAVVLIGESRSVADQFRFPIAAGFQPGVYYHANVVDAILQNRTLAEWPVRRASVSWLAAAVALLAGAYFWNLREWWKRGGFVALAAYFVLGLLLLGGGWIYACYRAFGSGVVLPAVLPLAAIASAMISAMAGQLAYAVTGARRLARRNRNIELVFERQVSVEVLETIKANPSCIARTEVREVAVLFCDIRRYTATASHMKPERVATMLNEYFESISGPVLEEHGFIDKFIGDAMMAVFGVPLVQYDLVERAARAALAIKRRLHQLNGVRIARGDPPLHCGIGIHCGPAAAGHIGSARRANYTVVGDTVNMAARIEELTGAGEILISAEAAGRLSSDIAVRPWKEITLRGSDHARLIYEITGPAL